MKKEKIIKFFIALFGMVLFVFSLGVIGSVNSSAFGGNKDNIVKTDLNENNIIAEESKKFLVNFYKPILNKEIDINKLSADSVKLLYSEILDMCPTKAPIKNVLDVSSKFGWRKNPTQQYHQGIDFRTPIGTKVYATMSGDVEEIHYADSATIHYGYGRYILIQNNLGFETRYAHLSSMYVKFGQHVERGQLIGAVGATGNITGINLHYEVIQSNELKNPQEFILIGIKDSLRNNFKKIENEQTIFSN